MKKTDVCIIDYGVGNTYSVANAITQLNYKVSISNKAKDIEKAEVLVLPGVGAFEACYSNLIKTGLVDVLNNEVLVNKKPIMGICVGMQLMADCSEENGIHKGLGWISGRVIKFKKDLNLAIPHVGWNNVVFNKSLPYDISSIDQGNFYFDHSYYFECASDFIAAEVDYGGKLTAAVRKDNIFGVQFHPEKSQNNGLRLFRSFINSCEHA